MLGSVGRSFGFGSRKSAPSIITSGLQLYLAPRAYSGSGTSWTDSSNNAHTVTLNGAPTYSTTYFTFDGSTQYYDTNQSLDSESFSVGMWFRTSSTGVKMLISKETPEGTPWNYRIWLNNGTIVADIAQSSTQSSLVSTQIDYNDNNWHYVMFTRDDSNWYLFVDGTQENIKADDFTGSITNSQEVWFGRSAYAGAYQFSGDMGECFVYNTVLSAGQIQQNYNATRANYGL